MTQGSLIIYGIGGDGQLWEEEEFQTRREGGGREKCSCVVGISCFFMLRVFGALLISWSKGGQKNSDIRRVIRGGEIF